MSKSLDQIEAMLAEIEALDAASKGQFRQAEDRQAFDIAARIERKMAQGQGAHGNAKAG